MQPTKKKYWISEISVVIFFYIFILILCLQGCDGTGGAIANGENEFAKTKIESAISCTNGLSIADSTLYAQGGGSAFGPTELNTISAQPGSTPEGMAFIPGGTFSMGGVNPVGMQEGGHESMNDARPVHRVYVDAFYMDVAEVTNAQFEAFVKATGYVTVAEQKPTREEFPDAPESALIQGSIVFSPPSGDVSLDNYMTWWSYVAGADWRHPSGVNSNISGKGRYPVVQVAWEDAMTYAKWAGKRLPTEAEWEFAARGAKPGELYPWGNQLKPDGIWMTNIFEGKFPNNDLGTDGFIGTAPIKQFKSNAFGIYDMAGNVWEWCTDWYRQDYYKTLFDRGGVAKNPTGPESSFDPTEPGARKKIQRGGSFLCTDQYCTRYMTGTRGKGEWRSAANHIGFRCVQEISK